MNPYELTKDPDSGIPTIRVRHGCVVLTKEEDERIARRIGEMLDENAKLRELAANMHGWLLVNCEKHYVIPRNGLDDIERDMRELGIELEDCSRHPRLRAME